MTADARSAVRATPPADTSVRLDSRLAVRVVNISLTGVLIETHTSMTNLKRGDHFHLTVPLGEAGFTARLEVGREDRMSDSKNGSRVRVGCAFVDLDPARQRELAEFLANGLVRSGPETAE